MSWKRTHPVGAVERLHLAAVHRSGPRNTARAFEGWGFGSIAPAVHCGAGLPAVRATRRKPERAAVDSAMSAETGGRARGQPNGVIGPSPPKLFLGPSAWRSAPALRHPAAHRCGRFPRATGVWSSLGGRREKPCGWPHAGRGHGPCSAATSAVNTGWPDITARRRR